MKKRYEDWINSWNERAGRCHQAALAMVERFPELRLARGYYNYVSPGYPNGKFAEHWWCVDGAGEIVDPTVSQFRLVEAIGYEEVAENERLCKCLNCGTPSVWQLCGDDCEEEYVVSLLPI